MKVMYAGDDKPSVPITETIVTESLQVDFPSFQFTVGKWRPFIAWVEENYPQDIDTMLAGEVQSGEIEIVLAIGERRPSRSQESIDLWRQHVGELVAEQS